MRKHTSIITALTLATAATLAAATPVGAATRHHMLITGPGGGNGHPSWVYDNNPVPSRSTLVIRATAYSTAHDTLRAIGGTSLCVQRQSTHGGTWHKLVCKNTDKWGDVRFLIGSAPHYGWYYRIHHYTSTYYYAATSWKIHPIY